MKNVFASSFALLTCLSLAVPASAQSPTRITTQPAPGEEAVAFAERIGACEGYRITSAQFENNRTFLRVQCEREGMAGGLAAAGLGAAAIIGIALASDGGGSSTPSTTP